MCSQPVCGYALVDGAWLLSLSWQLADTGLVLVAVGFADGWRVAMQCVGVPLLGVKQMPEMVRVLSGSCIIAPTVKNPCPG